MKQEELNIDEYIESGVLEIYALGMISPEEKAEVEAMAAEHPEVRKAILELEEALGDLAIAESVKPPPSWKEDILANAFAAVEGKEKPVAKALPRDTVTYETHGPKSSFGFLAIAATVVLLVSLGINFKMYLTLQNVKGELYDTEMRVAELENDKQVMVANFKNVEQNLAVMRDPNTATFVMKGIEGRDPNYRANIYWNSTSETVYLDVKSLPEAPSGKQYQLWALKDGTPIDMGVFNALDTEQILLEMGSVPGADAFAVTLEKAGGVASPTLEEMYVYGGPVQS